MKNLRIIFESERRVLVCVSPGWLGRLFGRPPMVRYADCRGYQREWVWAGDSRSVPEQIANEIDRQWRLVPPMVRAWIEAATLFNDSVTN